jgi:hypothetical protein
MARNLIRMLACVLFLAVSGCAASSPDAIATATRAVSSATATATTVPATPTSAPASPTAQPAEPPGSLADVISVEVTGDPGAYRLHVGVLSPDTGCEQYADWWEVVSEEGALIYRRVLLHSHVGEQPFERSGGPVPVEADVVIYVRAHMHPGGYGGAAFRGSAQAGFEPAELPAAFAAELAEEEPLPQDCAF